MMITPCCSDIYHKIFGKLPKAGLVSTPANLPQAVLATISTSLMTALSRFGSYPCCSENYPILFYLLSQDTSMDYLDQARSKCLIASGSKGSLL
ncbi:hypothetical protein Bpfe_021414 [Biomphalaria pfeifferi]|uniref:Uncharacterized protein n=1 Tax=Biomphalaria pfeifferi TaxID=112525 RepID=A0AAD8B6U2_BIOPF|nr:hypothetical protein Bpfe_021414 [Biomphalaria pfeifferi]